jgi:ligand-binding sensor domain-containing protein
MQKLSIIFFLTVILNVSCSKDDQVNNFPSDVKFDISYRMLEGKYISSIAVSEKGAAFIGSGNDLYYKNGSEQKIYTLEFPVLDLAIAQDESVWIGTNGGGLGHLTKNSLTWYTVANSGLPRDYVRHVEIAPDGKVWFTSCANKLGGLGIYDGEKFEFLTPENSPLNQNIIVDIKFDSQGRAYIGSSGTVGRTNIYRITGKSWECLGDEKGTFYWVFTFDVSTSGLIYLIEDFSLSSSYPNSNKLYEFSNDRWEKIDYENMPYRSYSSSICADRREYCWMAGLGEKSFLLNVYDGKTWESSPDGLFPDDFVTTIETDSDNNIWVGTYKSGVFILNQ